MRVALGAEPRAVVRLVIGGGLRLAAAGLVIGAAAAAGSTRLLESMLDEVSPVDPLTFAAIALLVGAVALVAAYSQRSAPFGSIRPKRCGRIEVVREAVSDGRISAAPHWLTPKKSTVISLALLVEVPHSRAP